MGWDSLLTHYWVEWNRNIDLTESQHEKVWSAHEKACLEHWHKLPAKGMY